MSWSTRSWGTWLVACFAFMACDLRGADLLTEAAASQGTAPALRAQTEAKRPHPARRRAVLIGISDYSASRLARGGDATNTVPPPTVGRVWPNLGGPVNDVQLMREMLVLRYGFAPQEIITLTDQKATRAAILKTVEEHLVKPAGTGDLVLFYFAGHGSQVRNSQSKEPDGLDESLVPADSRLGVRDIRDKELRLLFNRILDQGARLTVMLDSCHSGSGARGLPTGARTRGVKPDFRDVADGLEAGPRPEDRGALVLAAAQDFDFAWETRNEQGQLYGAFSWAWARAMRDAAEGEPAVDTFLRAQARLRAETPFQEPVLAGNAAARLAPFLGDRKDGRIDRTVVAVERVAGNGILVLQGGWAHGLTLGSELRLTGEGGENVRLKVTAMQGLGRCEARILALPARSRPIALKPGSLLEVVGWAAPTGKPLHVWIPRTLGTNEAAVRLARELARQAAQKGVRWVADPTEGTSIHVLRWRGQEWELLAPGKAVERLGSTATSSAILAKIPTRSSLFVQIPAPLALAQGIAVGPGTRHTGIQPTNRLDADYILVGRLEKDRVEYAWLRPAVGKVDQARTGLPVRTAWHSPESQDGTSNRQREAAQILEDAVLRLRKIHAWLHLDSPPGAFSPYGLVIKRARDGTLVKDGILIGNEEYGLVLRAKSIPLPAQVRSRYVYVFTIDSYGKSALLFPRGESGSVENHFPLAMAAGQTPPNPPPIEIPLGPPTSFAAAEPFGIDTYFLLSSDELLPNPWILEWDGVLSRGPQGKTPLEELLSLTGGTSRGTVQVVTPLNWTLERIQLKSVPPARRAARGASVAPR